MQRDQKVLHSAGTLLLAKAQNDASGRVKKEAANRSACEGFCIVFMSTVLQYCWFFRAFRWTNNRRGAAVGRKGRGQFNYDSTTRGKGCNHYIVSACGRRECVSSFFGEQAFCLSMEEGGNFFLGEIDLPEFETEFCGDFFDGDGSENAEIENLKLERGDTGFDAISGHAL